MSVMTSVYTLICFHLAIHTLSIPSMRYVYPVYSIMIFFTFMLLAETKWITKILNKIQEKRLSMKKV